MARYKMMSADIDNEFKDIFTSNIENFVISDNPTPLLLEVFDITNFSNKMQKLYNRSDLDDLVLEFNNVNYIGDLNAGDTIFLPSLSDLQKFITKNRK